MASPGFLDLDGKVLLDEREDEAGVPSTIWVYLQSVLNDNSEPHRSCQARPVNIAREDIFSETFLIKSLEWLFSSDDLVESNTQCPNISLVGDSVISQ